MSASYDFKGYDNFVLQEYIDSILTTKLDMNRFMTIDESLAMHDGLIVKVHKYVATPSCEILARGDANSNYVDANYTENVYKVQRAQSACKYFLDDEMADPKLIETKLSGVAESMINKWTDQAISEYKKTWNQSACTNYALQDWADAINKYCAVHENEDGLFFLCDIELKPTIQKVLGDDLKYSEGYIKNGSVTTILGVPVFFTKALKGSKLVFLANKECVTAYLKKNTFIEQDHNVQTKENEVVASRYSIIALTDETKCVMMAKAQATDLTCTTYTAGATTISGAATTGAKVTAYIYEDDAWVKTGSVVTAANSTYSITADENLVSGDKLRIEAFKDGVLPQYVEVTVE